jgi:hypothetical protein
MHVPVQPPVGMGPPPINWATHPKATHPRRLAAQAFETTTKVSTSIASACNQFSMESPTKGLPAPVTVDHISPFKPRVIEQLTTSSLTPSSLPAYEDISDHASDSSDEVELVAFYANCSPAMLRPPPFTQVGTRAISATPRRKYGTANSTPAASPSLPRFATPPATPFRTGDSQQLSTIPQAAIHSSSQGALQDKRYYVVTTGRRAGIYYDTW